jgi:lipid-A-disaccharide synthase
MVNLIAEKEVVPELVQHNFTAENVVAELKKILPDGSPRQAMISNLAAVRAALRAESSDSRNPAERAAGIVRSMLAKK